MILGPDAFWNTKYLCKKMDFLISGIRKPVIFTGTNEFKRIAVRGTAKAADHWCGRQWLFQMRYHPWKKPADKSLSLRNQEMIDDALRMKKGKKKRIHVILFWDERCQATRDMLRKCKNQGIKYRLIKPKMRNFNYKK